MLPKTQRLTKAKDFSRLSTQGRSVFGPYATMRLRQVKEPGTKIAFITSTKIWKKAVDRNRIKRRFRHICRNAMKDTPDRLHILLILKPDALRATHDELAEEIRRLFSKIPEALQKPASLSPRAKRLQDKRKAKQG